MKTWKRILAMFLVTVMAVAMLAGCGDKDKDDDKKTEESREDGSTENKGDQDTTPTPEAPADEFFGHLEEAGKIQAGDYSVVFQVNSEGQDAKGEIFGQTDGTNFTMGIKYEGPFSATTENSTEESNVKIETKEIVAVIDGSLFLNLTEVMNAATTMSGMDISSMLGVDTLGWFEIPLPDEYANLKAEDNTELKNKAMESLKKILEGVEQKDSAYTITEEEDLAKVMDALADFVEKDAKAFVDAASNSQVTVDLNAYVKKLIDFYYDDAVEIAAGLGMSKEQIDEAIKQIESEDLNAKVEDKAEAEGIDYADAAKEIREAAEQVRTSDKDVTFEAVVKDSLENGVFKLEISFQGEGEGQKVSAQIASVITEKDVKITKPAEICTLKDLAPIVTIIAMIAGGSGDDSDDEWEDWE